MEKSRLDITKGMTTYILNIIDKLRAAPFCDEKLKLIILDRNTLNEFVVFS